MVVLLEEGRRRTLEGCQSDHGKSTQLSYLSKRLKLTQVKVKVTQHTSTLRHHLQTKHLCLVSLPNQRH